MQFRPGWFEPAEVSKRLSQAAFATAVSMPSLCSSMFAVPVDISLSAETLFSFLLFSAVIAVPFFFSGVLVCLSLTRTSFPIGRIYFADLVGAGAGCFASVLLLKVVDAPSGIFVISALLFLGAACYAAYAEDGRRRRKSYVLAAGMLVVPGLNGVGYLLRHSTHLGQGRYRPPPPAGGGSLEPHLRGRCPRSHTRDRPKCGGPAASLPSPKSSRWRSLSTATQAPKSCTSRATFRPFTFLRYDVTSLAAQLRPGGTAAIIGVGGGRDVLNCALNGFQRIVGIEINSAIVISTPGALPRSRASAKSPISNFIRMRGEAFSLAAMRNSTSFKLPW